VHFDKCKKHNWICEPIVNVTRIDHGFSRRCSYYLSRSLVMPKADYAVFEALNPFFEIIQKGFKRTR